MKTAWNWISLLLVLAGQQSLYADHLTLANPGFEDQLTNWVSRSGVDKITVQVLPDVAHSGKFGLRIQDESTETGADVESESLPASPDQTYTVNFWARCISGNGIGVYLRFFDAEGKWLTTIEAKSVIVKDVPPTAHEWQSYRLTGATPPGAANLRVAIHSYGKAEVVADFDDFEIAATKTP